MRRYLSPVWPDQAGRVVFPAAELAQHEGGASAHHFGTDARKQRFQFGPECQVTRRHILYVKQQRMRRRKIGVAAFVKGAVLVAHAAWNKAPETIGELYGSIVPEPSEGSVRSGMACGKRKNLRAIF